jgi:uncharacterized protein (TIGR03492 family)
LVVATGDIVAAAQAPASNRPYIIFLSAHSSYYQRRVDLALILWQLLCSEKCLAVFTRDSLTAADLNRQGLKKAQFVGNPVMDNLNSTGKDLQLMPGVPTIALLPLASAKLITIWFCYCNWSNKLRLSLLYPLILGLLWFRI